MTNLCAAALFGSILLASPPRVGVVTVGEDAAAAGDLQRAIELRLSASRKAEVVGAAEIAAVLPAGPGSTAPATRPLDPAVQKEAASLLREATDAYYQDRAAIALDRLGALAALHERAAAFPVADRVRMRLWRTAVFLALRDTAQAEAEALTALNLDPDLVVDLNEFRPSVRDAVERVRARGLRAATIVVPGLPSGATLELDGRPVTPPFKALSGRHELTARAPGRRDVKRIFEAGSSDLSVPMYLPVATDGPTETALTALATSSQPPREAREVAERIASRLDLDWLIVAVGRTNDARGIALSSDGDVFHASPVASGNAAYANLAAWFDQRILAEPAVAATPRPTRTPGPVQAGPGGVVGSRALAITANGGLVWSSRNRRLSGDGGSGFDVSFGGVGPRVTVDASLGAPFAHVEAAWITYGISTLDVTLPDGSKSDVDGGTTTFARLQAGWRHAFTPGEPDAGPSVYAALGGSWESHAANDVRQPGSGDLGLLASYQRTAVEVALGGRMPLNAPLSPAISGGLVVAPTSTWSETPSNTSGRKPSPAFAFGWSLGVAAKPSDRLTVSLDYTGSMRSIAFEGTAKAPLDPALTDPTLDESFHSLGVTAGYRF